MHNYWLHQANLDGCAPTLSGRPQHPKVSETAAGNHGRKGHSRSYCHALHRLVRDEFTKATIQGPTAEPYNLAGKTTPRQRLRRNIHGSPGRCRPLLRLLLATNHSTALTPALLSLKEHEEEPEVVVAFRRHCRDWSDGAAHTICCQLFLELGGDKPITKDCHR